MEISVESIKTSTVAFLHRFHMIIFTVFAVGGLAVAIFLLNNIITKSGESGDYQPISTNLVLDQETIERVNQLKSRDESSQKLDLSGGRSNPFVE